MSDDNVVPLKPRLIHEKKGDEAEDAEAKAFLDDFENFMAKYPDNCFVFIVGDEGGVYMSGTSGAMPSNLAAYYLHAGKLQADLLQMAVMEDDE